MVPEWIFINTVILPALTYLVLLVGIMAHYLSLLIIFESKILNLCLYDNLFQRI